jgi:nitroreductase
VELTEVMRTTPATRDFTDEPVEDAVVEGLLESARFAPSGGNRQPWRVIVVKDPAIRRAVRDHYVLGSREYLAHVAEGRVPFAPDEHGRWDGPAVDLAAAREVARPGAFADHLDTVPVMMLLCVDLTALAVLDNGLGRQSIVGGGSIYPFGHNVLLAARNAGLGGVMTTIICREEAPLKSLLGIPEKYALAGMIVLGHPRRSITRLRRRPVDEFARIDRFDGVAFAPDDAPTGV